MPLLMCPNCNEGMQEVRRNEMHIDVCPKCRGVWLDRGELEKLLHSAREVEANYERERESWMRPSPAYQPQRCPSGHGHHGHHKRKKKFSVHIRQTRRASNKPLRSALGAPVSASQSRGLQ